MHPSSQTHSRKHHRSYPTDQSYSSTRRHSSARRHSSSPIRGKRHCRRGRGKNGFHHSQRSTRDDRVDGSFHTTLGTSNGNYPHQEPSWDGHYSNSFTTSFLESSSSSSHIPFFPVHSSRSYLQPCQDLPSVYRNGQDPRLIGQNSQLSESSLPHTEVESAVSESLSFHPVEDDREISGASCSSHSLPMPETLDTVNTISKERSPTSSTALDEADIATLKAKREKLVKKEAHMSKHVDLLLAQNKPREEIKEAYGQYQTYSRDRLKLDIKILEREKLELVSSCSLSQEKLTQQEEKLNSRIETLEASLIAAEGLLKSLEESCSTVLTENNQLSLCNEGLSAKVASLTESLSQKEFQLDERSSEIRLLSGQNQELHAALASLRLQQQRLEENNQKLSQEKIALSSKLQISEEARQQAIKVLQELGN